MHRCQKSQPIFQYQPLVRATGEIRLLRLNLDLPPLPGTIEENILVEARLQIFSSASQPEYHALSYVWGPGEKVSQLLVNGQLLGVAYNLDQIMKSLHAMRFDGWIWIDALCIDQADEEEKTVEVQRMSSIYEQAVRVLTWVGHNHDSPVETFIAPDKISMLSGKISLVADSLRSRELPSRCSGQCRLSGRKSFNNDERMIASVSQAKGAPRKRSSSELLRNR